MYGMGTSLLGPQIDCIYFSYDIISETRIDFCYHHIRNYCWNNIISRQEIIILDDYYNIDE